MVNEPKTTPSGEVVDRTEELEEILGRRVLVNAGPMGTSVQEYSLDEDVFRGDALKDHSSDLKGAIDVLSITQPQIVEEIQRRWLEAGADILETNTFNSNSISMSDYALESHVYEMNVQSARIARRLTDEFTALTPEKPRFACGVIGPTNRTASISPRVSDPGYRNVTFDQLVAAYEESTRGLLDGGSQIILVETVFDTLNAKAALYAISNVF